MFEKVTKDYKMITQIGHGVHGGFFILEKIGTSEKRWLKSLLIEDSKMSAFEENILVWKSISESKEKKFFVEFNEIIFEGNQAMIVLDYCENGNLESLIKKRKRENQKFEEKEIMKVLIEGMTILKELGRRHVMHRDIKPAEMLIGRDGRYKVGLFFPYNCLDVVTFMGTLEYMAAEVVSNDETSHASDVYSLGVVLYEMMVGKTPFSNERGVNLMNVLQGKYERISASLGYSEALVDIIHACLLLTPAFRPSAAQVLASPLVVEELMKMRWSATAAPAAAGLPVKPRAVAVPNAYECANGLTGLNRDVLMRLVGWADRGTVRSVVGVSQQHCRWVRTRFFRSLRYKYVRSFTSAYPFRVSYNPPLVHFGYGDQREIVVDLVSNSLQKKENVLFFEVSYENFNATEMDIFLLAQKRSNQF